MQVAVLVDQVHQPTVHMDHRRIAKGVVWRDITFRNIEPETTVTVVEEQQIIDAAKAGNPMTGLEYSRIIGKFVRRERRSFIEYSNARREKVFGLKTPVIKLTQSTDVRVIERQKFE